MSTRPLYNELIIFFLNIANLINHALTRCTLRSLAPARAAAKPERGRSSAGEKRPAGRGGAGGGIEVPRGGGGPGGGGGVPLEVSMGGKGGGGGGGGWPARPAAGLAAGMVVVGVTVEPGGRGGGGGGVGMVIPGVCVTSGCGG